MDRRDIRAESPTEKSRGFMPAVSVNPGRLLFTAGMTGRNPDGSITPGGMGAQTQRAFERLRAIVAHAGGSLEQSVKQMLYVTALDPYLAEGRAARAPLFGEARPAATALVVRRLADPAMLIEAEVVVDLPADAPDAFALEKYNVEDHGLDFFQGVIVNGGRLVYLPVRWRILRTVRWRASTICGARQRKSTRTSGMCCRRQVPRRPAR